MQSTPVSCLHRRPVAFILIGVAVGGLAAAEPVVDTWPGFRGDGSSRTEAHNLPLHWSPTENLAWRLGLPGYGQSSPVVWKERIFVTSVEGAEKEKCIVLAAEVRTGKVLWRKTFAASQRGKNNASMSRAAPTPVADINGLYVFFESGDLIGLTHAGEVKWRRSLTKEYGEFVNHHGLGSSLAQTEKAVIVLIDHNGPSYLIAIDKATGKNIWKAERTKRLSWTTPVVTNHSEHTFIFVSSNGSLTCYDAENGAEAWTLDNLSGNLIPSPTVADGLLVVGAGESGLKSDRKAAARSNCCLRLVAKQGKTGYERLWQGEKAVLHHASPVIYRGYVYLVTKTGVLYSLDAKTGEEKHRQRLKSVCWATPVAAGEHIYFFGKDGKTTVIETGPKFRTVAINRLWSDDEIKTRIAEAKNSPESRFPPLPSQGRMGMETMLKEVVGDVVYGVAVVDRTFFFRTGTELICVRVIK